MTASMYILLLLALIFANAPFLSRRLFGLIQLAHKHFGHHLLELAAGFGLIGVLAYVLEFARRHGAPARLGILCNRALPLSDFCLSRFCVALFWQGKHRQ